MARPPLEVADVFRAHGAAWRKANAGHVSLAQLKVMSAIETCRTAALGGHVERCEDCAHERVAYNSCRNRHCPKCQAAAARQWLEDREAELLPVPYYHVVFTLPASIGAIAFQNKAAVYDLLFRTAAETLITIAADPKHLGARIGLTAVLHTWGSALTHHPHVHVIVPGGGLSPDGSRWIACKPGFFLPVRVLSRLFRRLFLDGLAALHAADRLAFLGDLAPLAEKRAFDAELASLRCSDCRVWSIRDQHRHLSSKCRCFRHQSLTAATARAKRLLAVQVGMLPSPPLTGRVGDWRAGLGRSSCSLLARSFVCECHTISTMPRFQPPPRRTQHADFLALRSPACFAPRLMGPILPEPGATFGADRTAR